MTFTRQHKCGKRGGFSLVELLLAVAIMGALLVVLFDLFQDYARKEMARATNKYMSNVAASTMEILKNPTYFYALYEAAKAAGGGYQLIADSSAPAADNITQNFTVNGVYIQPAKLLNSHFGRLSPLRAPVRILLSIADNPSIETDSRAFDVFIVSAQSTDADIVKYIASAAGEAGAWIDNYTSKGTAVVTHAYGSTTSNVSARLASTDWYTSEMSAALTAASEKAYLVYYKFVNYDDIVGDYLYRKKDTLTANERNTMHAPLNMGGNDIYGVDDFYIPAGYADPLDGTESYASSDCANHVLCVNGTASIKGSASVSGSINVSGSAYIADSMQANEVRIQNGLNSTQRSAYGAAGTLVVDGTGNTGDTVHVTNNATFNDGVTSGGGNFGTINATTTTIPDGGTFTTNTIGYAKKITATDISAKELYTYHKLRTAIVKNGDVEVTGRTGVIDILDSENMIYNGGTVRVPRANIETMTVNNFGTCDNGCGE